MNEVKNKQYKARNVLSKSLLNSTLVASLLLSGFAGVLGTTGTIAEFSVVQVAEAAAQQQVSNVIAGGSMHSLVITPDGNVYGWGFNGSLGRLGDGTKVNRPRPTKIQILSKAVSVQVGIAHSVALTSDGSVYAWGANGDMQLGDGTTTNRSLPTKLSGLSNVASIEVGSYHSHAITMDGSVYAWGRNMAGELGDGTQKSKNNPTKINGLSNVIATAAGANHSLAVTSDGSVYTWGANGEGQLGDGTQTSKFTPMKINGLTNVVAVEAGDAHSLAITSDGSVYAWGYASYGQLGDGTQTRKTTPIKVDGLENVIEIEAGEYHSLALTSDGSVYSWGNNASGQLGDGTTTRKFTPTKINGLSNVIKIEAGQKHSLAMTKDGSVYAWGENVDNQLGDGTNVNKLVPTLLVDIKGAVPEVPKIFEGGTGTIDDPYLVSSADQLDKMRDHLSSHFKLTKDIDLTEVDWTPVGTSMNHFTGSFDGGEHTIDGLKISTSNGEVGLFGTSSYATLKNLKMKNVNIVGGYDVGALLGRGTFTTIENIAVEGSVSNKQYNVGGIVGYYGGEMTNVSMKGSVSTEGSSAGGLVGMSHNYGTNWIKNSFSHANVVGIGYAGSIGGVIGYSTPSLEIENVYSTGDVKGGNSVGGISGTYGNVKNAYATGSIEGFSAVGGIVGYEGSASNVFALSKQVIGDATQREQIGRVMGTSRAFENAFALNTMKTNGNNAFFNNTVTEEEAKQQSFYEARGFDFGEISGIPIWITNEGETVPYLAFDPEPIPYNPGALSPEELIAQALDAVVVAETSIKQPDVERALTLVNKLSEGTEKSSLIKRLDAVQQEIELVLSLEIARESVETAERTKLQVDVDASRSLVNDLPENDEKKALVERLNKVQNAIDEEATESFYAMIDELKDMKVYLLTGEGTRADVLAMKEALNDILDSSKLLLNESHRTEVAHHVQDVLDIIDLLEIIWDKLASGELAGIDTLVTQLPTSNLKTKTLQEVDAAKTEEANETLNKATASVEKAEQSKLQADIDVSRSLVNALAESTEKARLIERLDTVQKINDDAKLLAEQVSKATSSVKKAETSKIQADIDAARKLVEALPSVSEKTALTVRLDAIIVTPEGAELVKEAQELVDKLNEQSSKEQITIAKELVDKLPDSSTKMELSDRITSIELNQKAINAVVQAEKMQTNYNITLAEKAINHLSDGPLKTELAERIQQLKLTLEAESKVKSAELTKRDPYITDAMESINKLIDSPKKTELTNRMKVIQDALATEAEIARLEEATTHVVLAEQHKRDPYLTSAKDLVSKLQDGVDKTALEARLKAIQDAAPVAPEVPEVDPALLKAAETQVSYAERYKRDPYLTRAQEAVDKLPASEVKTALQDRLNVLSDGASDQIEAANLKTASDSVAKAETASDLFVIEEARSLVNGLKDDEAKTELIKRLNAIEVTGTMQFAYDLKLEIDNVSNATIKQALQEAYTAVGVAKERQTSAYMTKASKSIEALNKYKETHSKMIEKLSTFFIDMQKELEMQKLVVAADNAVQLSEKYKRATYFTKAQVAIDVLSEGKAKTDLQARLDAVIN